MILITGGAFQGKTRYAKDCLGLCDSDIVNCEDMGIEDAQAVKTAGCITRYEVMIRRLLEAGYDPIEFTKGLECKAVIMNETGCGIIPLEEGERRWREMTGRAGCLLAERAERVVRVCCGIGQVIK